MAAQRVRKVFIACNLFPGNQPELLKKCTSVEFVHTGGDYEKMKDAEVILGDPANLGKYLYKLPNLKWFQSTWAGVDGLMKCVEAGCPPSFTMTRFSGYFGPAIMQYVVGNIISYERNFRQMWTDQKKHKWNDMWETFTYRPLHELAVGILGLGEIGGHVAQACKALGMTVWGLGRRERLNIPPCVDQYRTMSDLSEVLQASDYICNLLPSTPSTKYLLSGDVLQNCKGRKAILVNVGRGDIIHEESLVQAIKNGWLGGAVLDVFENEPLAEDSPLWDMPEVVITPHNSGVSFPDQVLAVFMDNLALYEAGKPLKLVVDWEQGY